MKSLAYQFGLHKLEFIDEFSHKTKMNISREINLNNLIRERIYKFVNVISNYWMINLEFQIIIIMDSLKIISLINHQISIFSKMI